MLAGKKDYIPSIVILLLGILVILLIPSQINLNLERGQNLTNINARTLPYLISILIVVLSILEIFLERRRKKLLDSTNDIEKTQYLKFFKVALTFVGIVLWIVSLSYLGFIISTALLLISVMLLMGNRKWMQLLLVPLLTGLILNYVFTEFVGRNLPQGVIFP